MQERRSYKIKICMLIVILLMQIILPTITMLIENNLILIVLATDETNSWDISATEADNVTATLSQEGILTISGTGKMKDWTEDEVIPWNSLCSQITKIVIEEGITEVSSTIFRDCDSLEAIEVAEANEAYCTVDNVLYNKDKTELIQYPREKKIIRFNIPEGVEKIADYAFYKGVLLKEINIPDSLINIGNYAFLECTAITSMTIPNEVTEMGEGAFSNCTALTNITLSQKITTLKEKTFYNCTALTGINIPTEVTCIEKQAFKNCTAMTYVELPQLLTSIEEEAFYMCSALAGIDLPESLESIETGAFYDCKLLRTILLTKNVANLGEYVFKGCSSLQRINVNEENTVYSSEEGILFNKEKSTLICYPAGSTILNYYVPEGVTTIENYAFSGCENLMKVIVLDEVTEITEKSFENCPNSTVYCKKDSYTESYCVENNIRHVADGTAPTITVTKEPGGWTNGDVAVTIEGSDGNGAGLDMQAYSFNGGEWSENNVFFCSENQEIKVKVRDAVRNEREEVIKITNIDKDGPINIQVTFDQTSWIKDETIVTVTAEDEIIGLKGAAYSFDGGEWQESNQKAYTENQIIKIKVRDALGNETTYETTLNLPRYLKTTMEEYETKEYAGKTYLINIQPNTKIKEVIQDITTNGTIAIYDDIVEITNYKKIIKTGMTIKIEREGEQQEYIVVVRGDTNADGQANIQDILSINKHRLNKTKLQEAYLLAGNVTEDENVNIMDILQINKYRLGKIESL